MSIAIQRHRGTTIKLATYTGPAGEVTIDTTKWTVVVQDGTTAGGYPLALADHTHPDATSTTDGFMSAANYNALNTLVTNLPGGTINYQFTQANGSVQPQEDALNFSSNFALSDDSAGQRTTIDLSNTSVGAGTYTKLTVNTKGRVTSATFLSSTDIPNINPSQVNGFNSQVQTVTLDSMAAPANSVNMNGYKIVNMADPVSSTDAATKQYVDTTATGLTFKQAVRVASTTTVNVGAPGTTIDGVTLAFGDRILLKNQGDQTTNGIYSFNGSSSPLSRSLDADSNSEIGAGMFVLVTAGSVNAGIGFVLSTPNPIYLGTTNLSFVPFSSGSGSVTAGNGINVSGSIVSVNSANTNRIAVSSAGVDLASISGLTPGTYQQFTVDAYGRITGTPTTTTGSLWQTADAGLSAIATLGVTGFVSRTGTHAFAARTLQPGTGISITNGDGSAGNTSIAVVSDTVQEQVQILNNGSVVGTRSFINLIPGTGASFTMMDNSANNRVDVTIGLTPGGGAAPATSAYVTLGTDGSLTNERVLAVGTGLSIVDGGSGNNVTLSLVTDLGTIPGG